MRIKKRIKDDILKILKDSGLAGDDISKVLNRLVNYAYEKAITTEGEK